jgi:hypothetical protein
MCRHTPEKDSGSAYGFDASRQKRKLAGAGGVAAMLLLALVAHLLRKTYD